MHLTSIRRRLLVAFALPILALALMSGLRVTEANDRSSQVRAETSAALAAGGPTTFITALMDERNIVAVELLNLQGLVTLRVANSREAIAATDALLAELQDFLQGVEPETRETYEEALATIERDLAEARRSARDYAGLRSPQNLFADEVYGTYTTQIAKLHTANDESIARIDDAELRNRARAIANLSATSDRQSQMARYVLVTALEQGDPDALRSEAAQVFGLWGQGAAEAEAMMAGDPERQQVVAEFYRRPNQKRYTALVETFLTTGEGDVTKIIAEAADDASPNAADAWTATRASIVDRAAEMTEATDSQRRQAVTWFLIAMAGSVAAALISARSLATPLLRLAAQARHLAGTHLPTAIAAVLATPHGDEVVVPPSEPLQRCGIAEVDQVVDALNQVQTRSLDLAVGQAATRHNSAASLVNVARRVQGLVGRQIELIDTTQRDELDPDRLDTIFRLDHLATRIRRNSESLVVLAGTHNSRRASFGPPVSVIDVVRAAVAEVEQYDRVHLDAIHFAHISGQASTDLAHILAELIENGLAFSPPTTDVSISASTKPTGSYQITVTDAGIGMSADARAEANDCLAGNTPFGEAATKYLGHHVIGRLASRHGISVNVDANDAGGVTATITVPRALVPALDTENQPAVNLTVVAGTSTYADLAESSRSLHDVVMGRRSLDTLVR